MSLFYIAFYLQDQARLKEVILSHYYYLFVLHYTIMSSLQQLAALLISRQVIGNLKESALPYMLEHLKLAKMSFDLWGALSPTRSEPDPNDFANQQQEPTPTSENKNGDNQDHTNTKRSMSQAELESSLYKVSVS